MSKIFCDGSGFNGRESKFNVQHEACYPNVTTFLKNYTNNEMEYSAVIKALEIANDGDEIYTDSRMVVNQIVPNEDNRGKLWKVHEPHLIPYRDSCLRLLKDKKVNIYYIPREQNLAGKIFE